jgi:MFS transporter, DHA1 family, inner membrane transport protein
MAPLSPARRWLALLSLALGGFGIGATEFVAMGLLPDLAHDLLPGLSERDPAEAIARAGWLISAYALGVVVGAPVFAVLSVKLPRKVLLLLLMGVLALGTVASAVLPSFGWVLLARFVAALPHGAFFGTAALVAGRILGPGNQGKGIAFVLTGLTVSNVVGVPVITRVGQLAGWRAAYLVVAFLFVLTFVAIVLAVPRQPSTTGASIRTELRVLRRPQLWLMGAVGALGFGGFFAVYTYIAEVVRAEAGLSQAAVPWVLAVFGLGMTVGNLVGGWAADRNLRRTVLLGFPFFLAAMAGMALAGGSPVGVFAGAFAVGATNMVLIPGVQARLIAVSGEAQLLGAALVHSALNIANSVGAALGGLVIAAGHGYLAPSWVGVGLGLLGLALVALSFHAERRSGQRSGASSRVIGSSHEHAAPGRPENADVAARSTGPAAAAPLAR